MLPFTSSPPAAKKRSFLDHATDRDWEKKSGRHARCASSRQEPPRHRRYAGFSATMSLAFSMGLPRAGNAAPGFIDDDELFQHAPRLDASLSPLDGPRYAYAMMTYRDIIHSHDATKTAQVITTDFTTQLFRCRDDCRIGLSTHAA